MPHKLYDYDLANHVIIVNDWLREESTTRLPGRRAGKIGRAAETFLINGKGRFIVNRILLILTPGSVFPNVSTISLRIFMKYRVFAEFMHYRISMEKRRVFRTM